MRYIILLSILTFSLFGEGNLKSGLLDLDTDENSIFYLVNLGLRFHGQGGDYIDNLTGFEKWFQGTSLTSNAKGLATKFRFETKDKVNRSPTLFHMSGGLGVGYQYKKHRFYFDFSFIGFIPYTTENIETTMNIVEEKLCTTANISDCRLAANKFVNASSGIGNYKLTLVTSEDFLLIRPRINYSYPLRNTSWGELSLGGSLGLLFGSSRQVVSFSAERTDETVLLNTIEAKFTNSANANFGLEASLFTELSPKNYQLFFLKASFDFGFVNWVYSQTSNMTLISNGSIIENLNPTNFNRIGENSTMISVGVSLEGGVRF